MERLSPGLKRLLDQRQIQRSTPASSEIIAKELDLSREDLEQARQSLKINNYRQATTHTYSSIRHAARALLYRMGYRENVDQGLLSSLPHLYESRAIEKMIREFSRALRLSEEAEANHIASQSSADTILKDAEEFLEMAARISAAPRAWFERPAPRRRRKTSRRGA